MERSSDEGGIYEELDQLVELMTKDKATMSTKISQLEECVLGLQNHKQLVEAANTALRQKNFKLRRDLASQQEQSKQVIDGLESTLHQTRKEVHRGRAEGMDYVKQLEEKKEAELQALRSQFQERKTEVEVLRREKEHSNAMIDELHKKVDKSKSESCEMAATLELQKSQSVKLAHQLSDLRKHCETLKAERDGLAISHDRLQQKLDSAENMLLAFKGRAANTKKCEDQLKNKCSALQAALEAATSRAPSIVKVSPGPKRTREELKLREECHKKDDVIESSSKQLKYCKAELMKQNLRMSQMSRQVETHKRNAEDLARALEELRIEKEVEVKELKQKVRKYTKELKESWTREKDFDAGKEVVEKSLTRIESELKEAKGEIETLKQEMVSREDRRDQNGLRWDDVKKTVGRHRSLKSREILSRTLVKNGAAPPAEDSTELREYKENYERLKKACTRRCTELAAEVWRLKQMLQDRQDLQDSFNSSDNFCSPTAY